MNKSVLCVFLSSMFFATGGLFFKMIPWNALAIGGFRSGVAFFCIGFFLIVTGHKLVINKTVLLASMAIFLTNTLYALSNKLTTAGNTVVLQFSMPVFVIIIMAVFFGKRPTVLQIITCLLTFGGIILFFIDSLSAGNMLGNVLALTSGVMYAIFFVMNTGQASDPLTVIFLSYIPAFFLGLPFLLKENIAEAPLSILLCALALGVIQQSFGHILLAMGLKKVNAVSASLISGIEPIANPLLVAVFYREMLTPLSMAGAVIVVASILSYNVISEIKGGY